MTPAARVQAAIELLDQTIEAARTGGAAADTLIGRYFKERRYAGSKDRRAVRELVYRAIRLQGERPVSGRASMLGLANGDAELLALFDGSAHGPAAVGEDEPVAKPGIASDWLMALFDPLLGPDEFPALLERAPLDLRVNRLKGDRSDALAEFPGAEPTPHSPIGIRLPEGTQVEASEAWASGLVEVQDEGSQLLAFGCTAKSGSTVIDLCAGAGGKTLALAAEMANQGKIIASDTDRGRLSRMTPRLTRSGVSIVDSRLLNPNRERETLREFRGAADLVLIDAPCSGTGTWRRNPEARWRLTPERLARLVALQAHLIDIASELVRPGGILVYAVCSLLRQEGRDQAEAFGNRSAFVDEAVPIAAGRPCGPGKMLTPGHDHTDGFFVARWRAPC